MCNETKKKRRELCIGIVKLSCLDEENLHRHINGKRFL